MIVKMSKYAFMVYHKEYDAFLELLRSLGVVHIRETKSEKTTRGCNASWPSANASKARCAS